MGMLEDELVSIAMRLFDQVIQRNTWDHFPQNGYNLTEWSDIYDVNVHTLVSYFLGYALYILLSVVLLLCMPIFGCYLFNVNVVHCCPCRRRSEHTSMQGLSTFKPSTDRSRRLCSGVLFGCTTLLLCIVCIIVKFNIVDPIIRHSGKFGVGAYIRTPNTSNQMSFILADYTWKINTSLVYITEAVCIILIFIILLNYCALFTWKSKRSRTIRPKSVFVLGFIARLIFFIAWLILLHMLLTLLMSSVVYSEYCRYLLSSDEHMRDILTRSLLGDVNLDTVELCKVTLNSMIVLCTMLLCCFIMLLITLAVVIKFAMLLRRAVLYIERH